MLSQTWPTSTVGLLPHWIPYYESQVEDLSDPDDENNDYYAPPCKRKIVSPKKWRDKYRVSSTFFKNHPLLESRKKESESRSSRDSPGALRIFQGALR